MLSSPGHPALCRALGLGSSLCLLNVVPEAFRVALESLVFPINTESWLCVKWEDSTFLRGRQLELSHARAPKRFQFLLHSVTETGESWSSIYSPLCLGDHSPVTSSLVFSFTAALVHFMFRIV